MGQRVEQDVAASGRQLRSGDLVDHYQVVRQLGQGGMGEVYLARDTKLGRKVALKLVNAELVETDSARRRFMVEAEATASFNHPHIVTLYAVGEHNGRPYVALEYLEGQTLRQRIDEARPGMKEALRVTWAITSALSEAHDGGIAHLDLKPGNVLIARDGRPRVLDFGLARFMAGPAADDTSPARGTPRYMAPEQWRGEDATRAADIWALGVILFELVYGVQPYTTTRRDDLREQVTSAEPVPQPETFRLIPTELTSLTLSCLDKQASSRPSAAEVLEVLEQLIRSRSAMLSERDSPFRGLMAFTEQHAQFFFGREGEIASSLERLRGEPVLAVVGPSGAGKSSFVQAGLIPRLREQGAWAVLRVRPGSAPFEELAHRLMAGEHVTDLSGYPSTETGETVALAEPREDESTSGSRRDLAAETSKLAQRLRSHPEQLSLVLHERCERERTKVLLFVDQLEELYTLVADPAVRQAFMRAICTAADDRDDPVRVCFTVRDDYLGRIAEGSVARAALSHVLVLRSPGRALLREVLVKPLELVRYAFEHDSMIADMLDQVAGEPAGLPLLQFTTRLLWDRRDKIKRRLLRSAYDDIGGVAGALATHADGVLDGLPPDWLPLARQVLLRLVTPELTRRVVPRRELVDGLDPAADDVVTRLTEARLLSVRRARPDDVQANVELAHESLIRDWQTLARWLDDSSEELAFVNEVGQAAALWIKRGRRDHEVWRGDALAEAQRAVARLTTRLPDDSVEFLAAGARVVRRISRRKRVLVAVFGVVLVAVAVAALVVAVTIARKEREARQRWAEAQREASRAAMMRGDVAEARARLRGSLETEDSVLGRALWLALKSEPLVWRQRLGGAVYDVAFAPDGRTLAAVGQTATAHVFDVQTKSARVLRWPGDQLFSVTFSADGRFMAAGSWSGRLVVWTRASGQLTTLPGHVGWAGGVSFTPDGNTLVSGGADRTVRVWDVASGKQTKALAGHTGSIDAVQVSSSGRLLASAGWDKTVRIWDMRSGTTLRTLEGHTGSVSSVAFSPDETKLVSGGWDNTVRLWDPRSGALIKVLGGHRDIVYAVAVSPDGTSAASASLDGTIRVWDLARGVESAVLTGHAGSVRGVAFSPDSKLLASAGTDHTVRLWDLTSPTERRVAKGHNMAIIGVDWSGDGKHIVSASYDQTVRVWNATTGKQVRAFRGHSNRIFSAKWVPGSNRVASASADGTVRVWNVTTGAMERLLLGHTSKAYDVSTSADGRLVAAGGADGTIHIWEVATGRVKHVLRGHKGTVDGVSFSADGAYLASGGGDWTVRVWKVDSGEEVTRLVGHDNVVPGVAWSPDGRMIASCDEGGALRVWDWAKGEGRMLGRPTTRLYRVSFHPDGKRIGVAGSDGLGRVWRIDRDEPPMLLVGHHGEVNEVRFSPDGKWIATGGNDATVQLWHAATGKPVWRAPLLLRDTREVLSHRGWQALDPTQAKPTASAWRRAMTKALRASVAGNIACAYTDTGSLEAWDRRADRRLFAKAIDRVSSVVARAHGCAVVVRGVASAYDLAGNPQVLARTSTAMVADGQRLFVADGRNVIEFNERGGAVNHYKGDLHVTAMVRVGRFIALGFQDGNIELIATHGAAAKVSSFEAVPASPVVSMIAGPRGTLVVGFANGLLGIWHLANGARLDHARLHGAAIHLGLVGGRLYAATERGDHLVIKLDAFNLGYCELLREVWARVPVLWEGGLPKLAPLPRKHRCAP